MVSIFAVLLAALAAFGTVAKPLRTDMALHERRIDVPDGYVRVGAAVPNATLKLRLGLASKDFISLERILMDVSTPSSSKYGQHLSQQEVRS
jgi:tripeptidyl-peptidase-1